MAGFTDILLYLVAVFTLVAVLVGVFSLYLLHIYRKFEHIPSPPRKSFFLGHGADLRDEMKTGGSIPALMLKWLEEIGETYVIIILGKPMMVTVNHEAVKKVLGKNHPKSRDMHEHIGYLFGYRFLGHSVGVEWDNKVWTWHRSLFNQAFDQQVLKTFMNDFNETSDDLMTVLTKKADGKDYVTLLDEINRATLDVIAKVGFGMKTNSLKNADSPFPQAISTAVKGLSSSSKSMFTKFIPFLDREFRKEVGEAITLIRNEGRKVIEERKRALEAGKATPTDILSFAVEANMAGVDLDIETFLDDFVLFFIAGQETTSPTICFVLMELGRNPKVLSRVRKELDSVFGERTTVTFEDVGKLEYIWMVVKETLRLYPPASILMRELATDQEIGGYMMPKGTKVTMGPYLSGRSSLSGIPDPLTFDPDRFSPDSPKRPPTYAYFPFSLGPRSCLGMTFAEIEAKVLLAKFIQRFEFDLNQDPNQPFEIEERGTLRPKDGTQVTLKLRDEE